jgi:phosphohistidine phosphatase
MKTLILMRHAKSGWAEKGMGDHDRRLNKRGRLAAPVMAHWLDRQGYRPDHVLCSSALRTRETVELMREAVPSMPRPEVLETLYHAGPGSLKQHLARLPGTCGCALLVGHEPGLSTFLRTLGGSNAPPECRRAYDHLPTAAIAVLEADIGDWGELGADGTEFAAFVTPQELME